MVAKTLIQRALVFLATTAVIFNVAAATTFTVGSPGGSWNTNTDLQSWASNQSFVVGDNLLFQYTLDHTVVEVTEANYDSCQATSPIQLYMGGTTNILLLLTGKRYFICGTADHCGQGMKLEVNTLAGTTPVALPLTPPVTFLPPGIPTLTPPPAATVSVLPPAATTAPPGSANVTSPPPRSSASKVMSKIASGVGFVISLMLLAL